MGFHFRFARVYDHAKKQSVQASFSRPPVVRPCFGSFEAFPEQYKSLGYYRKSGWAWGFKLVNKDPSVARKDTTNPVSAYV